MIPSGEAYPRRAVITGVGAISPLGDDPEEIGRRLRDGATGFLPLEELGQVSPSDVFPRDAELDRLELRVAGGIPFDVRDYLEGNPRPVDRTGHLAIIAAQKALAASGWSAERRQEHEVGLVLGTMFGGVHTISAFDRRGLEAGPKYVKPLDFANTVINAAAGQTAIWLDLRGINSTVAGGTVAGLQAISQAAEQVRSGRARALLAGGSEELAFESFYGFQQAGMLHPPDGTGPVLPRPFDARRAGFVPAEGAAFLMLEDAEEARNEGRTVLAIVRGHGSAFDPSRGRESERTARALEHAVRQALDDAGLDGGDVGAIVAGAHGGRAVDAAEARGLHRVFGERLGSIPTTAPKSQFGEALGAGGAFQALTLLSAFGEGVLPGVAGYEEADSELPLLDVRAESRPLDARVGLLTSVGIDGLTCALVLERGGS